MAKNKQQEAVDMTIVNFVYSGLSLEQMNAVPKWLVRNLDKNKPLIKDLIEAECTRRVIEELGEVRDLDLPVTTHNLIIDRIAAYRASQSLKERKES